MSGYSDKSESGYIVYLRLSRPVPNNLPELYSIRKLTRGMNFVLNF